ncbi:MAG: DNA recombination protein RmuC [Ignavibacteriae bacterium]|nr:DNA recombination protein RmuC [Ignavibacteriota bacterium]
MDVITIIILVLVLGLLVFVLMKLTARSGEGPDQSAMLMQQQIDSFRTEVSQSLKNNSDALATSLKNTQDTLLTVVNDLRSNVTQQLQSSSGQMDKRLDNAAEVIRDVKKELGELGKATQEIKELGQSVSKLEEMLRAPKLRGGLGELLLEDLLKQVLPVNAYDTQFTFKNGQTVDAIINTAGGKVPVDSKFPLENFRKMAEAKTEQEKKAAYRLFVSDVKKHVDAIAQKYIVPDEGTFDFALMYIPAENIYYETIIKDESYGDENGLYAYAANKHVVPVSPNSFYAHLRVIALGLKGLQIERSAKEITQNLNRLGSELQRFSDLFETLGSHLNNAKNKFDEADKKLNAFSERLKNVQSLPESETGKQIDAFSKS